MDTSFTHVNMAAIYKVTIGLFNKISYHAVYLCYNIGKCMAVIRITMMCLDSDFSVIRHICTYYRTFWDATYSPFNSRVKKYLTNMLHML